jgi:hypothetical protein
VGFYPEKSCRLQLYILKELVRRGLVYVVMYDLSIAEFNKMSRTILRLRVAN